MRIMRPFNVPKSVFADKPFGQGSKESVCHIPLLKSIPQCGRFIRKAPIKSRATVDAFPRNSVFPLSQKPSEILNRFTELGDFTQRSWPMCWG
jgi:hypothetical protein